MKNLIPWVALGVMMLWAGCATTGTETEGIVSERTFKERVLRRYVADPTFPLYTLYVGVHLDSQGRVTKIWCDKGIDSRSGWTRSVKITLPRELLKAAAAHIETRGFDRPKENSPPREFFVTYSYSPQEPLLLRPGYR